MQGRPHRRVTGVDFVEGDRLVEILECGHRIFPPRRGPRLTRLCTECAIQAMLEVRQATLKDEGAENA